MPSARLRTAGGANNLSYPGVDNGNSIADVELRTHSEGSSRYRRVTTVMPQVHRKPNSRVRTSFVASLLHDAHSSPQPPPQDQPLLHPAYLHGFHVGDWDLDCFDTPSPRRIPTLLFRTLLGGLQSHPVQAVGAEFIIAQISIKLSWLLGACRTDVEKVKWTRCWIGF